MYSRICIWTRVWILDRFDAYVSAVRTNLGTHDGCVTTKWRKCWQLPSCRIKCVAKSRRKRLKRPLKLCKKRTQMTQLRSHQLKFRQMLRSGVWNTTKSWPRKNKLSWWKDNFNFKINSIQRIKLSGCQLLQTKKNRFYYLSIMWL